MFFKKIRGNIIGLASVALLLATSCTVFAAAESYTTYYNFACSTTSASHSASATPTVTVKTYNMVGDTNDDLWIELDKKYWYGWAASGSTNDSTQVSSVYGTTSTLTGKNSGTYRLLFGKSSMLLSGDYDLNSDKWYADVDISYNK